ncbi:MAG TPA: hypothetical protein PK307_03425 [Spirochaetota bacterium]|nr:hypothetical protein [Spirochaetota bacterium]
MKVLKLVALMFILAIAGCGKEDEDSIIPGYLSPGEFRPKGILTEKAYTLTDGTLVGYGNCSGEECLAVYALWVVNNYPVEGVAIKDDDTVDSRLFMKITRVKFGSWSIRLTFNGIEYNGAASASDITLDICNTATPTFPAYPDVDDNGIPDTPDGFTASDSTLARATLTVVNPVALQTDDKTGTINLNPGDEIVAHAFNGFSTSTCP